MLVDAEKERDGFLFPSTEFGLLFFFMGGTTRICGWFALLLLFSGFQIATLHGADTIRQGEFMRDGQTLVSSGNKFELGFFIPPGSENRYVGIWFKQPSVRAVAWVADRENYLTGNYGFLTVNDEGNLMIHDGGRKSIMLTSFSASSTKPSSATLLDNGNFILKNEVGKVAWQSFDYPTDTFLAGMKIGVDRKLGRNWSLVSWRSPDDPAPGSYSYQVDTEGPLRLLIKRNGSIHWSSGTWNGAIWSLTPETRRQHYYNESHVSNEDENIVSISLGFNDTMTPIRVVLDSSGQVQVLLWVDDPPDWRVRWVQPRDECDEYNACAPNARCNLSASVSCTCLQGFFPTGGRLNKSSGRCVRRTKLMCGDGDGFYAVADIKFPDQSIYEPYPNLGIKYCESRCRSNCSCTAYASAYRNGTGGCMFWTGDLIGLRGYPFYINGDGFASGDLYIRLAGTDLGAKNNSRKTKRRNGVIIGAVAFVVVLGFFLAYLLRRKFKSKEPTQRTEALQPGNTASTVNDESYLGDDQTNGPNTPFFSFATIEAATDNFAPGNKLGQGGFGSVYKGKLAERQEIAVKRLSRSSGQGLEEFKNEVLLTSKLQHRNLVRLLGWSVHGEEKILIYEYMPNKSLDLFLFEQTKKSILNWGKRMQIVEGIAQGLLYLHRYSRLRIIHRDLKASNILLDSDMNPKISDFGMARMFDGNQSEANTRRVCGTYGYMSPEYAMGGVFSTKSDVFSFGVLLLEIVGGKRNTSFHQSNGPLNLLGHAWELWREGRSVELIDPMLVDSSPTSEILRHVQVALLCVQDSAMDRPTMSEVVHMLTDTTAAIAVPKHPAFFIRRAAEVKTSLSKPTVCSVNDVTISEMEGR